MMTRLDTVSVASVSTLCAGVDGGVVSVRGNRACEDPGDGGRRVTERQTGSRQRRGDVETGHGQQPAETPAGLTTRTRRPMLTGKHHSDPHIYHTCKYVQIKILKC